MVAFLLAEMERERPGSGGASAALQDQGPSKHVTQRLDGSDVFAMGVRRREIPAPMRWG